MKKYLLTLIMALSCISSLSHASSKTETCINCEISTIPNKLYLSPSQILINENNILFEFQGNWYATDSLQVDQGGVYVMNQNWRCPGCGRPLDMRGYCWTSKCRYRGKQP